MHENTQKELDRIAFLATMYRNSSAMRAEIDELNLKNNKQEGDVSMDYNGHQAIIKGIKLEDLQTFETITGRKLTKEADGSFSMEVPNRYFGFLYHHSGHNNTKADILSIAQAVKASGYDSITMKVNHTDPDFAMKLAREAYESCRETGFDANKITINMNGKDTSVEDLFKGTSKLQAIESNAKAYKNARETTDKGLNNEATKTQFKKEFEALRARAPQEATSQPKDDTSVISISSPQA